MKTINLFATVITLMVLSVACQEADAQSKRYKKREAIERFFVDHLNGKNQLFNDGYEVKLNDVAEMQKSVWETWIDVNNQFQEEKLIKLEDLNRKKSGKWNIPENLEPNAVMPYYWGYKGEKPADGYPLYLYLHGSGGKDGEWENGFLFAQRFEDAPSVYFIPQIPNIGDYYRWYQKSKQYAWEKMLRLAFVSGDIDPNRVYFWGISEGGYGSQRLASFYADYLAGAGPMAGGEPLKNAPVENCRNMAFSLRTGANDAGFYRNKLTQYTKDAFEKIRAENPEYFVHEIELIPGMGHGFDFSVMTPWLKQYVRNPYPKTVTWENYEMDGLYRKGFYNIVVNERSNNDESSRTYYKLSIDGNNISLNIEEVTYEVTETDPRWGIELKFNRSYKPATKGKVTIYLCDELVDLSKKVTLTVNGKKLFNGKVKLDSKHMVNSCAIFFDPERLYPAAIEVEL